MDEQFYTVDEVAQLLKVTRPTVYTWMRENGLKWYQVGKGRRRISASDLRAFLESGRASGESGDSSEDQGTKNKAALVPA